MDRDSVRIHVVNMGCPGSKFDDTYNSELSNFVDKGTFESVLYKINYNPEVRKYLEKGDPWDWDILCICLSFILCPLCLCSDFPNGGPSDSYCWRNTKGCVYDFWNTASDFCCGWKDVNLDKCKVSLDALLKEANENPSSTCVWSYDRIYNNITVSHKDSTTN